ncbi:MAG: pyrroloquinoline quinone precursor peptide PqqA [Pseudomonas sp.]
MTVKQRCATVKFKILEMIMTWSKPAFTDMRFGFEITMYIANR